MTNDQDNKNKTEEEHNEGGIQPDPKTLHTSDPQDNMEGPISSLVNGAKDSIEGNDEADRAADKAEDDK